jgi:hypothetical protein
MSDDTVICWNCLERSPKGRCIHCDVEMATLDSGSDSSQKKVNYKYTIQLKEKGEHTEEFEFNKLRDLVSEYFDIIEEVLSPDPMFLVSFSGLDINESYQKLEAESHKILQGLTPIFINYKKYPTSHVHSQSENVNLIVKYAFVASVKKPITRLSLIFYLATLISIFLSGLVNTNRWNNSRQLIETSIITYNLDISSEVVLISLSFSIFLIVVLSLRELINRLLTKKYGVKSVESFFLPTIPIFELGTVGSFLVERQPHKSREGIFNSSFYGTVITWVICVIVFISTLSLAEENSAAAKLYSNGSIVASGRYEPVLLVLINILGNALGLINTDVSLNTTITQAYLLHPITIAALAGIYICGFHMFPVNQLNGGALIHVTLGRKAVIFSTILIITMFLIVQLFWLAIITYIFYHRLGRLTVLNEFTELPRFWILKLLIMGSIVILSFPVPV